MTVTRLLNRSLSNLRKTTIKTSEMDSYVWIDLEMTGLDVAKDTILEAGCIITNTSLKPVHEGIHLVINHPEAVLDSMNSWCKVQHEKTGLTSECKKSKLSLPEAEKQLSDYIKHHTNPEGDRYIAGNSVYMDKIFLEKHMPTVNNLLHYRVLDISVLKILFSHMYPEEFSRLKPKKLTHRAIDDILESIQELKAYQRAFFKT